MKKIFIIICFGLFISNNAYPVVSSKYKAGKGPLNLSKNTADVLEYYFSGGKMGKYAKKQKESWIGEIIVISPDGRHYSYFITPTRYMNQIATGNYVGRARKDCKKKSGQECFLFASRNKIVWDNGSDKKKRRLKKKDIKAGKTLQILEELGFYNQINTQVKKEIPKESLKENSNEIENDLIKKLKDLKKLYDDGWLSEEEFAKAKKKILN